MNFPRQIPSAARGPQMAFALVDAAVRYHARAKHGQKMPISYLAILTWVENRK